MSRLEELEDYIRKRIVEDGVSQLHLCEELKATYPESIGFSERSMRRFCASKDIHRTSRLSKEALNEAVMLGGSQVTDRLVS